MKSKLFVLGAACALMLAGCGSDAPQGVAVESITLDETSRTLAVGESFRLVATVLPEDATDKTVTWSASGDGIVSVDDGLVTALKVGTSTVTATAGKLSAECVVTVATREQISDGEEGTKPADTWIYWADQNWCGSTVTVTTHEKFGNQVSFTYTTQGTCDYGFQVFYKNSQLVTGASYRLTMTVNSNKAAADGLVKINGTYFPLSAGDNAIAVKYVEGGATASSIQFVVSTSLGGNSFTLKDWAWEGILDIPGDVAVNAVDSKVSFRAVDGAQKYLVKYYNSDKQFLDEEYVNASGDALTKVPSTDGNYYASVTAISSLDPKYDSIESELVLFKVGSGSVVPAGGPKTNIVFGEEKALPLDKFVYWNANAAWNLGGEVIVNEGDAYTEEGLLHIAYTATGACDFGLQIFYKNSELVAGKTYKVSFKMKSVAGGDIYLKSTDAANKTTLAGDTWTDLNYTYTEANGAASLKVLVPAQLSTSNTVELKGFSWVEVN